MPSETGSSSKVNYYQHHLGDYARDAGHLSMLEDGAYRRLLDVYYATEKPLPPSVDACCKLAKCRTPADRKAVRWVLENFFVATPDGHRQKRCDEEIEIAKQRIESARENGKKGGRPKKPSGLALGSDEKTQPFHLANPGQSSPTSILQPPYSKNKKEEGDARGVEAENPKAQRAKSLATARATPGLDLVAWDTWVQYRSDLGKPIKTCSASMMAKKLAGFGPHQAAVVTQSAENQWSGLFALKADGRQSHINGAINGKTWQFKPGEAELESIAIEQCVAAGMAIEQIHEKLQTVPIQRIREKLEEIRNAKH